MTAARRACVVLLSLTVLATSLFAIPVRVNVLGANGARLGGALVMVQRLQNDTEQEVSRELTNPQGQAELKEPATGAVPGHRHRPVSLMEDGGPRIHGQGQSGNRNP